MRYQVAVFFDGPRCNWSQKLDPAEVVYVSEVPWLWLARWLAKTNVGNTGRCGYAITANGETVEESRASTPYTR